MKNFTVGEALYYVTNNMIRRGNPEYVTISKVGRKWLYCDGMRIDKETLVVDGHGYSSPGKCWLSQDEYEQHCLVIKAWDNFKILINHRPPRGVSVEDIQEATRLLFHGDKND
jgi:hypothetical protein